MEEKDIFNLDKIDDLPPECKNQLRETTKLRNINNQRLYDLFKMKGKLNINEVIVGLYRLHKMKVDRKWARSALNNLSTIKLIKKVQGEIGSYQIVGNSESEI